MDLFCLQETKIHLMLEGIVRSLGSGKFHEWISMEACGTAGGILVVWDKRSLELLDKEVGSYSMSCRLRNVEDGFVWVFSRVYEPLTKEGRTDFWEELGAVRGLWEEPCCIGGDFNVTCFPYERSRRGRLNNSMRRFSKVIDELDLVDLHLLGGKFMWSGGLHNHNLARLDRFLNSQDWLENVGIVAQLKLSRPTFDHAPILLECGTIRRRQTPFRFENMWLKVEGFQDLLRGWWQGVTVLGTASFSISRELKEVKNLIKAWNKECFGRLEINKKLALN